MSKITSGFSMSLDGFIAGPHDDVSQVFAWYGQGDREFVMPNPNWKFKVAPATAKLLAETTKSAGVLLTARRTFEISQAWGGRHPLDVPIVVLTDKIDEEWAHKENSPFTFVTDGLESALRKAKDIAKDKNVVIGAPSVLRQCLDANLVDEVHIDLVPVLLGAGIRLFDPLKSAPINLRRMRVVEGEGVTHITFEVLT